MMGNEMSIKWSQAFMDIKAKHDAAYLSIDEAIRLEEQEKAAEAIEKYKQGISLIDQALSIPIESPSKPDATWEEARVMIQKMKRTRGEVLTRINSIQSAGVYEAPVPPPSYDEAMSTSSSEESRPCTYTDLAASLEALRINEFRGQAEIIYSHDNVKVYFIQADGTVCSTLQDQTLKIGIVERLVENESTIRFLQVGDWVYPLIPGVSPCYRTDYGAFVLPDLESSVPGSCIGIILPSDADAQVYDLLEDILHGIVSQQPPEYTEKLPEIQPRVGGLSGVISRNIISGAGYLSHGLVIGAQKAGEFLNYGTPKLLQHVSPASQSTHVPPKVQKGMEVANNVTQKAVHVTGFVADKVGGATMALGRFLAPHIQKHGTRLLSSGFNMSQQEASEKVSGVLTVAAGAVEGFSTVYKGLETSAGILGRNLANNTVKVVEHKYGQPSGTLAENTLYTVGNIVTVSHYVSHITPKGIAKGTVKNTGKAMVEDITTDIHSSSTSTSVTTNIYPNLSLDTIPGSSKQ